MPCQEWLEFQPSRSSAEKTHKVERASYLRPGTLTPVSIPFSEQEQQEVSKGRRPARQPGTEWGPGYLHFSSVPSHLQDDRGGKNQPVPFCRWGP